MQPRLRLIAFTALGSLLSLAACGRDVIAPSDSRAPTLAGPADRASDKQDDGLEPHFLNPVATAPAIANPVITFWAVKGRDQIVDMVYHSASSSSGGATSQRHGGSGSSGRPADSGRDSVVFAEFRVRAKSLAFRPDGSPIADGDSVLITMTLVDPVRGIIEFEPSGLKFSAKNPAQLKISFENANLDLNGDGVVDFRDKLIQLTFHIGVREQPGDPFLPLPSAVDTELDEVEAAILGFSGYAIEY